MDIFKGPGVEHNMVGLDNPWDQTVREGQELDKIPEEKLPITAVPLVRVIAPVLFVLLIVYFLYAVCVHPIDKLNLRLGLSQNCIIKLSAQAYTGIYFQMVSGVIMMDGDLIAVGEDEDDDPTSFVYYEVEGDRVTMYDYSYWWIISEVDKGELGDDGMLKLFDSKNYERVPGKLFKWQLKDSVKIDSIYGVRFERIMGKFTFTFRSDGVEYTMTFKSFGRAKLERIWEESNEIN